MAHVAKRAAARALVAHDHERGGTLAEAFADVRAGRFFAHRVQVVLAQDAFDVVETRARRGGLHANPLRLLQALGRNNLDGNACRLGLRFLLLRRIVGRVRGRGGGFVRGNRRLGERRHWAPSKPGRKTARSETKEAFYPPAPGSAANARPRPAAPARPGYRHA
ncbi:hypothetical protein G6F57_020154 [Rhizopus arrhizus]|nr:hypothetical protein G6F57_020154 [Rhizopus arrhizus]